MAGAVAIYQKYDVICKCSRKNRTCGLYSGRASERRARMKSITGHPLIIVTEEDVEKSRSLCGVEQPERIKESLDSIDEWCKKQDHLVEAYNNLDRNMLERLFLLARGSVEATKTRLDKILTSRGMMPELVLNRTVEEFDELLQGLIYIPLPRLYSVDQSRIMVTQFFPGKLDNFNLLSYLRYCFMIGEYRLYYDYCLSERYIVDLANVNLSLLSKINPVILKKGEILCSEGLGTKIKGIHILNAPPYVDKFLFVLKQALREKVASRIHVHSSYEDLRQHLPKEILPMDYGGDEQYVEKLASQWREELTTKKARQIIKDMDKLVSDETKRTSSKFNEEYMGMPGSFRKLTVD
ncbi:Alpha-tocopherol transfer protein [Papilio machaon]|uniref:Alpha-tocopherol transfer protein n=1 Tax=Papilio machaon TaxID=76193 RepID=A0A194R2X0_PAPMA|nr:Alpha-tocopherol transfer protein [Papilio machaon]